MEFLAGLLLLAYAFAHLAIWLPASDSRRRSFDAHASHLLLGAGLPERRVRLAAVAAAVVVAGLFLLAGFATIRGASWDVVVTGLAAFASLMLAVLYFHPWLSLLIVVDLAILVAIL